MPPMLETALRTLAGPLADVVEDQDETLPEESETSQQSLIP